MPVTRLASMPKDVPDREEPADVDAAVVDLGLDRLAGSEVLGDGPVLFPRRVVEEHDVLQADHAPPLATMPGASRTSSSGSTPRM